MGALARGSAISSWDIGAHPTLPAHSTHVLPQRIVLKQKAAFYVVDGSRIGTSSLRKGEFFHAPSMQQPGEAKVSFDAARLVVKPVLGVALLGELFLGGPWPRPRSRILDGDL